MSASMSAAHQQALKTHWALLMEILDISNLLLTELNAEDVLDRRTKQEIMSTNIKDDINQRFLEWLNQSPSSTFDICLQKLRDDGQNHIANLLDDTPGERPLESCWKLNIRRNSRYLSKLINVTETSGLIDCLWSKRVLNDRDRQRIQAEVVMEDRVVKLLEIVCIKSDRAFKCMIEALEQTNQRHIIPAFLAENGKIFSANAKFKSTSAPEILKQFEDKLDKILNSAVKQLSGKEEGKQEEQIEAVKEKIKELREKLIILIATKTGKSITFYLLCESIESMAELYKMINSRHFEKILEDIYNPLKTSMGMQNVTTTVTLTDDDLQFLRGISEEMANLSEKFPSSEVAGTSEMLGPASIAENVKNLKELLIELLDPDFGLLDMLMRSRTLTRVEVAEVKSENTIYKRNKKLLEFIIQKDKSNELMAAMNDTNQTHLVNFVQANGVYNEAFDLDWPLKEREMNVLNDNQYTLLDILDTSELVIQLYNAKVFNRRQREFIASKPTEYEKNEAFFDLLMRCSLTAFYKTIQCLKLSNQAHLAEILETGGIAVPVSATLNAVNLNSTEEQIVDRIAKVMLEGERSPEEDRRLLLALQLKLVAARRGH